MPTTEQTIFSRIQRRFGETVNGGVSWSSGDWTQAEVVEYLNERQARLRAAIHDQIGIFHLPVLPHQHAIDLPQDVYHVRRVSWWGADGSRVPLDPVGLYSLDLGLRRWEIDHAPRPRVYLTGANVPTTILKIAAPPSTAGHLRILALVVPDRVDGSGQLLVLPDELTPALRYGVEADMLRKPGRAHDPSRAAYCEARFTEAVEAARLWLAGWRVG